MEVSCSGFFVPEKKGRGCTLALFYLLKYFPCQLPARFRCCAMALRTASLSRLQSGAARQSAAPSPVSRSITVSGGRSASWAAVICTYSAMESGWTFPLFQSCSSGVPLRMCSQVYLYAVRLHFSKDTCGFQHIRIHFTRKSVDDMHTNSYATFPQGRKRLHKSRKIISPMEKASGFVMHCLQAQFHGKRSFLGDLFQQRQNLRRQAIRSCSNGNPDHIRLFERLQITAAQICQIPVGVGMCLEIGDQPGHPAHLPESAAVPVPAAGQPFPDA